MAWNRMVFWQFNVDPEFGCDLRRVPAVTKPGRVRACAFVTGGFMLLFDLRKP